MILYRQKHKDRPGLEKGCIGILFSWLPAVCWARGLEMHVLYTGHYSLDEYMPSVETNETPDASVGFGGKLACLFANNLY